MRITLDTNVLISANIVFVTERLDVVLDDPDDNRIIEAAHSGKVELIISQDKHLLNLKEYEGIRIVTPAEFLSII